MHCTKHEGAGNDFLVILDPHGELSIPAAQVVLLCDRHRGVGADGLIRIGPASRGCDLTMELRNADGSTAEMSGNGIRCLAQAAVDAGLVDPPRFTVATGAGPRTVEFVPGEAPGLARASVDMGPVTLGPERSGAPDGLSSRTADVGNPHLVVVVTDVAPLDLPLLGPRAQAEFEGGINVEWIAPGRDADGDLLEFRVWERGVGETLACGTGSVAAAAAARSWGLVGCTGTVRVRNPGGVLDVTLGDGPDDAAVLGGPVRKVADIDLHPALIT